MSDKNIRIVSHQTRLYKEMDNSNIYFYCNKIKDHTEEIIRQTQDYRIISSPHIIDDNLKVIESYIKMIRDNLTWIK